MHKIIATIVGMTKFHGVVGDGADRKEVKVAKFFALLAMEPMERKDADQEMGRKGSQVVPYSSEDFRLYDELKALPFPVQCELEIESFATSKGETKDVLISLKPRGSVKVAA